MRRAHEEDATATSLRSMLQQERREEVLRGTFADSEARGVRLRQMAAQRAIDNERITRGRLMDTEMQHARSSAVSRAGPS